MERVVQLSAERAPGNGTVPREPLGEDLVEPCLFFWGGTHTEGHSSEEYLFTVMARSSRYIDGHGPCRTCWGGCGWSQPYCPSCRSRPNTPRCSGCSKFLFSPLIPGYCETHKEPDPERAAEYCAEYHGVGACWWKYWNAAEIRNLRCYPVICPGCKGELRGDTK